jgi:beta-aspartyl-peptidase (threonine type)
LLQGGGGDVDAAWHWFVGCAAGGDIVVLRASGGDGYQDYIHRHIGGVSSVTTLLFHDRSAAYDTALLERLASAEGIFLAGGDQARYLRFWKDTPLEAALQAHVAAGKPLGGTSAGLAVLGEFSFAAYLDTITSEEALADPFHARLTLEDAFLALPGLNGVITDSHFTERGRLGRLMAFLARLRAGQTQPPRLLGLGIDEATALCVEPEGDAFVRRSGSGAVWLVRLIDQPSIAPGRPLAADAEAIALGPESRLNLRTGEWHHPLRILRVRAAEGTLTALP